MENGMLFFVETPEREPEYPCAAPGCKEAAYEEDGLKACEGCGKRFCAGCVRTIEGLDFCDACQGCAKCDKPAVGICDNCGSLVCGAHARGYSDESDAETGYRESGMVCGGGCRTEATPVDVVELQEALNAPF